MKKEEAEELLGRGRDDFDLGPIEDYLHDIATEREVPDVSIVLCTIRIEESAPPLRAVLERAANGEPLSDHEEMLLIFLAAPATARHADPCCACFAAPRRKPTGCLAIP